MRVLVCGSRDWDDEIAVASILHGLLTVSLNFFEDLTIVEGCARGADDYGHHFYDDCGVHATDSNIHHEHYPADWEKHGKAAGPRRNEQMLVEGKPDVVWAFKDGFDFSWVDDKVNGHHPDYSPGGTEDMVWRAKAAGIPVYVVSRA